VFDHESGLLAAHKEHFGHLKPLENAGVSGIAGSEYQNMVGCG
jgi:hypothetical protein